MKKWASVVPFAIFLFVITAALAGCGNGKAGPSEGQGGAAAPEAGSAAPAANTPAKPSEIRIDYTAIEPVGLAIKQNGWLEEEFKADGIAVKWVRSMGSNNSIEYLNSGSTDFGNSSVFPAFIARTNGVPLQTIYISFNSYSAIAVPPDSPLTSLEQLKGKKVAATLGTGPYIFLLWALEKAGLSKDDISFANLQHQDGKQSLMQGHLDAWSGLDPYHAQALLEGAKVLYESKDFGNYGVLNVRQDFADKYPDIVKRVLKVYEKARQWALENPDEIAQILANEGNLDPQVAALAQTRRSYGNPVPDDNVRQSLQDIAPFLAKEGLIKAGIDTDKVIDELFRPEFIKEVLGK